MKSFESLESQDERQFPPLPSRSAMPREVRDFMREWVAVMKELPVDSPEIQGLDLKFDGFGQTLYDASSDEIESYLGGSRSYIRDGSTRSLASALHYTLKRAPRESSVCCLSCYISAAAINSKE
ncbi:hypothetical protein FQN49_007709 [Arthroderma sp. PD_2]|nr:hypothetical protein FQN49_007709 [Arthroderma sp. PD_2]